MLNPYAPPSAPIEDRSPPGPTSIPLVCGILSICFGGLSLLVFLLASVMALAMVSSRGFERAEAAGMLAVYGFMALMAGSLLACGIGCIRRRAWARRWSVRWAIVALVEIVLVLGLVGLASGGGAHVGFGEVIVVFVMLLPAACYPVVLLALLTRPSAIAAMKS
jgi:hypothetical protein